jgi:hypothetical protein
LEREINKNELRKVKRKTGRKVVRMILRMVKMKSKSMVERR